MTDLTLYGTQPVPGMIVGRATDAATIPATARDEAAPPSDPAALAPSFHDGASAQTALLDDGVPDAGGSSATPSPVILPHTTAFAAPDVSSATPQPIGSGSFVAPPVATALPAIEPHQQAAPAPVAPAVLTPAPDGAQVLASVAPVLDAAHGALTAPTLEAAHDPLAAPLGELAGHVLDAATPAADLLGGALDAVPSATGLVGTTLDAVGHALEPIDHGPLDSFGGADPAAGIATLVGMVDSADAFDISHAVTASATQPVGSILDALAGDALPAPLLGDDAHHDITHVVDDHGIHLGL